MKKSDQCTEECSVLNMLGTNICQDNIQTNRHHSKKKKKHRSRHEREEGTLENPSHCVGQADFAAQENTEWVDSDKAEHSFSKKRHKSKNYSIADGEEEVNPDEQYLIMKKKHKSKEKIITAFNTEPNSSTKHVVDNEEHGAVLTSASFQNKKRKRKHSKLKEEKCDLKEDKMAFNPDENIFISGSSAKKTPNKSNGKSWTEDQDGSSVAHCKTKSSGNDASSACKPAGEHGYASVSHKLKKKIKMESMKETQAVESHAQSCASDVQVQYKSSFATSLDTAAELQISTNGDIMKKKKKKHKSRKQPLFAKSEMDKCMLETFRSDYKTDSNCSKINSYELVNELNRSNEYRLVDNIKSHKSRKKARPAESDMHSSADIGDTGNSVEWTSSTPLNTHEDSAGSKTSNEKSLCKKKQRHELKGNARSTESSPNDSANFSEVIISSNKRLDLSNSLEASKEEAPTQAITHKNHSREKKKKKKKSRKETWTENSIDLVYHTGTSILQSEITKDQFDSRKRKLKSECDMESANVSISQKSKNCESQKRRTTDSKMQDSTNIGDVDKTRKLAEGDLSDILEAATEVSAFENHTTDKIKKNCLSTKKTRSEEFVGYICLKDCTSVSQTESKDDKRKPKICVSQKARTTECEINDNAVIWELDKSQNQQTEADLFTVEAITEVTALENHTRGKNKKSRKSKNGTKIEIFETNDVLMSAKECSNYSPAKSENTKYCSGFEMKRKSEGECDVKSADITKSQKPKNCESEQKARTKQCAGKATVDICELDKSRDQTDCDPLNTLEVAKEVSAYIHPVREKKKKDKSRKKTRSAYCEPSLEAGSSNDCTTESQTGITEDNKGNKRKHKSKNESDIKYSNVSTCQVAESALSGIVNPRDELNLNYMGDEDSVKKRAGQKHKTASKGLNDLPSVPCVTSHLRADGTCNDKINHADVSEHRLIIQSFPGLREESESSTISDSEDETIVGRDYCGSLVCYLCFKEQADGVAYIHHLARQHELRVYHCPRCSSTMSSLHQWKQHIKLSCSGTTVKIRRFKCSLCPQTFAHIRSFKIHTKKVHQGEPTSYPCGYCTRTFTDPRHANSHKSKCKFGLARTEVKKTVKCSECGKMFSSSYAMYGHKLTMHSKMAFSCSCGIRFLNRENFYAHRKNVIWKSMVKNATSCTTTE